MCKKTEYPRYLDTHIVTNRYKDMYNMTQKHLRTADVFGKRTIAFNSRSEKYTLGSIALALPRLQRTAALVHEPARGQRKT